MLDHRRSCPVAILLGLLAIPAASSGLAAAVPQVVRTALQAEPPQLNPIKATDMQSYFVIGHTFEGLVTTGTRGDLVPGVATKWEIDAKGATFHLRKDAQWSDGKPVTARDFVFAWREVVDPKTGSEYAFIMYPIKNSEAIVKGKLPPTELGVTAVDDWTLKVAFEKPCPYFAGLAAMGVYVPVREDFYRAKGARFAADPQDLIANGPFMLKQWTHGSTLAMERNPRYWNAKRVKLDRIEVPFITADSSAIYNFFKAGKIDLVAQLARAQLDLAAKDALKIKSFDEGRIMYVEYNFRAGRPTTNRALRQAISLVFDSDELVRKVIGIPGTRAARGFIPSTARGVRDRFVKEYPRAAAPKRDVAAAKKLLEQARGELGGKLPAMTWLTSDTEVAAREAEYFQNLLKSTLGLEIKIDRQIPKQRNAKTSAGDFDLVSTGWGADYDDPMTYADLKASWNEANRGKYANPEVDRHIQAAQVASSPKKRMDEMAAAEKAFLADFAVLPLYERVQPYLESDRLSGVVRNAIGVDPDFRYASRVKE